MTLSIGKRRSFTITTPLYYVNVPSPIGSAYTTIATDVVARFQKLIGKGVLLITGTDEHGLGIQQTAQARGRSSQNYADEIADGFGRLWQQLNINYDRFSRTAAPRPEVIVREFFERVWQKGDIYLGHQQGWYCVSCNEFKEERDLLPGNFCTIHTNKAAEWRDEQNYFFRLSAYQAKLEALYTERPEFIQPESRHNEVLSFVQQGLQDFSISRVNLDCGFPIPHNPTHTFDVWFDALLSYVTALLEPDENSGLEAAIAHQWPIDIHLICKDILRFHAVYWPAMLMSAGLPMPRCIWGRGLATKDSQKVGRSLGNTLDPVALVEQYGADAVRYYFLREIEFGKDGDFSEPRFINTLNAELANDLGNLLNRTLRMAIRYCDGRGPNIRSKDIDDSNLLKSKGLLLTKEVKAAYENLQFSQVCETVLSLVRASNKFLDEQAPWSLYKQGHQAETAAVLYVVLESVRLTAYWLSTIIPSISSDIYRQLGIEIDFNKPPGVAVPIAVEQAHWGWLPPAQPLGTPASVFQRIELLQRPMSKASQATGAAAEPAATTV